MFEVISKELLTGLGSWSGWQTRECTQCDSSEQRGQTVACVLGSSFQLQNTTQTCLNAQKKHSSHVDMG